MNEATKQLNHEKIKGKVMRMTPGELKSEQTQKMQNLMKGDPKKLEKMKYYDSLLNLERKCVHFNSLFLKFRLKIIHKPFIILDMLRIMEDNRSPFDIFMCLYIRLRNTRKRRGFDSILKFVEHKNELADMWAYLAEKLLYTQKRDIIKSVKQRKKVEKQEQDKSKIMKRSLTFLFSVIGNFVRRNLRGGLRSIKENNQQKMRENQDEEHRKKEELKKQLDIGQNQGFFLQKFEKKEIEPEVKIVEIPAKVDYETFKVENTNNMFHHVPERRGEMNTYLESKTHVDIEEEEEEEEIVEKESQVSETMGSKRSLEDKQKVILAEINREIRGIKEQMQATSSRQTLTLNEEIELLSKLTNLMGLLKKYYENVMENPKFRDSKNTRKNFEQIMELIKGIIDRLLQRIEKENEKRRMESEENNRQETDPVFEAEERRSLLHIDNMNKNLKKEFEELVNYLEPKSGEYQEDESLHQTNESDAEDKQNEINHMLQEMLQNLGQVKNTMDNQNLVVEEEDSDEEYLDCKFFYFFLIISHTKKKLL